MQSPDHPDLPFLEALKTDGSKMYTPGRRGKTVLWIVVHDMEYPERNTAAEWTANYFHTGAGGRSVSSHYTSDNDSIWQCVKLADSAWTVGNSKGNDQGINWEFAGYASQSRAEWLDSFSTDMFKRAAPYIRSDAARYNIPLVTLTDAQVLKNQPGISSHAQLARVFGGSTHTDPGPNFPWDVFMQIVTGQEGDLDVPLYFGQGSSGEYVTDLQMDLLSCGQDLGPAGADGKYGPATSTALKNAIAPWVGGVPDGSYFGPGERQQLKLAVARAAVPDDGGGSVPVLIPHTHPVAVSVGGSGTGATGAAEPTD